MALLPHEPARGQQHVRFVLDGRRGTLGSVGEPLDVDARRADLDLRLVGAFEQESDTRTLGRREEEWSVAASTSRRNLRVRPRR